jgi:signal transduction histidine kinase
VNLRLTQRLYLRIWLAVILAVALVTLAFGWMLRLNTEQQPPRDVLIRDARGELLGQARGRPLRLPGQGVEFPVQMNDGSVLLVQLPPRPRQPGEAPPGRPWFAGPTGLFWMLGLVALAVALGLYPIVRWLTQRLEQLETGVARWGEGDLAVRVPVSGDDEVAHLAERFNRSAARIEQLVKSQNALLAANRSLLANASHELRSPLARIRMGLELLGEAEVNPAARREMVRNVAELDQLVDEILLASRLEAQEGGADAAFSGTREEVDLVGLVAEECARVDMALDASGGAVVRGEARLLRRAIRNLLENARRHAGTGEVELRLDEDGSMVEVHVLDRGPGVPEALRERIFEPFFRLPGASERDGGVGLGLALVKSIAARHGGSVRCESRSGGGASFVLRLPML